jgi:hypothetical protein
MHRGERGKVLGQHPPLTAGPRGLQTWAGQTDIAIQHIENSEPSGPVIGQLFNIAEDGEIFVTREASHHPARRVLKRS